MRIFDYILEQCGIKACDLSCSKVRQLPIKTIYGIREQPI